MGLRRSSPIAVINQICGPPQDEWERRNIYYTLPAHIFFQHCNINSGLAINLPAIINDPDSVSILSKHDEKEINTIWAIYKSSFSFRRNLYNN